MGVTATDNGQLTTDKKLGSQVNSLNTDEMMNQNLNQPSNSDAVLGSPHLAPISAVILGGIAGVKQRLGSAVIASRIAAIKDAPKYGEAGIELIIQGLEDESEQVQRVAYLLLKNRSERQVIRALKQYIPYRLFDCIATHQAGQSLAISPEGNRIAYLRGKVIRVSDLGSEEILYTIPKYPKAKQFFALSRDGKSCVRVINGASHLIQVWDQGELRQSLYGHEGEISAIAISPNDDIIASGSLDKTIKIWHLKTGKLLSNFDSRLIWGAHTEGIFDLCFSPDGKTLASSSQDGKIRVWDLRTQDRPRTLKGYATKLALSPDGLTLASTNWYGQIQLWNLATQKVERLIQGYLGGISNLAFCTYGRTLVTGGTDQAIRFWDVYSGAEIKTLTGHTDGISCLVFRADGQGLISGSKDKTVKVWGVI